MIKNWFYIKKGSKIWITKVCMVNPNISKAKETAFDILNKHFYGLDVGNVFYGLDVGDVESDFYHQIKNFFWMKYMVNFEDAASNPNYLWPGVICKNCEEQFENISVSSYKNRLIANCWKCQL